MTISPKVIDPNADVTEGSGDPMSLVRAFKSNVVNKAPCYLAEVLLNRRLPTQITEQVVEPLHT